MAYSMYKNKRGYFYDVRNLPYSYYGMHPMDVVEYQRGRPTKLPLRTLNRQFKSTSIQLDDQKPPLVISIQMSKIGKQQQQQLCLVLSNSCSDDLDDCKTAGGTLCVPETAALNLIQQLRKLAKWKPAANGSLPSAGQGLSFEDTVFKAHIVNLAGSDEPQETPRQLAIKVLAESRAKDPLERKELGCVLVPMDAGCLDKLRAALSELVVTESPLYHTESLQGSDGSKIYMDLIKDASAHYMKISQVTRDFRSIVSVPAGDVEALLDLLTTSLKAIKSQQQPGAEGASGKSAGKRKRGRNPRRRPGTGSSSHKSRDAEETAATTGAATSASDEAAAAETKTSGSQSSDGEEKENMDAVKPLPKKQQPDSSEDSLTVESRPVENGDSCDKRTSAE